MIAIPPLRWIPLHTAYKMVLDRTNVVAAQVLDMSNKSWNYRTEDYAAVQSNFEKLDPVRENAQVFLFRNLAAGTLSATAVDADTGRRHQIEADEWSRVSDINVLADNLTFRSGIALTDISVDLQQLEDCLANEKAAPTKPAREKRLTTPALMARYKEWFTANTVNGRAPNREAGEDFLRGLKVPSVRAKEKELRSKMPNNAKRGRPRKGLHNSAK